MKRLHDTSSLLTNKLIRTYLSPYSDVQVQEALKLTLLYGILHVQQRYAGQVLDLDELREAVRRCADATILEDQLPTLQQEVFKLEQQLRAFRSTVLDQNDNEIIAERSQAAYVPPAAASPPRHSAPASPQQQQHHQHHQHPSPSETSPAALYPSWWGDSQPKQPVPKPDLKPPRAQPRLAYSVQAAASGQEVDLNDLVTTRYLDIAPRVGSRGSAGAAAGAERRSPARAVQEEAWSAPCPEADPAQQQQQLQQYTGLQQQQQQRRPPQPPQSKVRQQVDAASERHGSRQRQRRQRLMSLITTAPAQPEAAPAPPPLPAEAGRPAQIAEQLMANPWTSWFMQPSRQRHMQQQAQRQQQQGEAEEEVDSLDELDVAAAGAGGEAAGLLPTELSGSADVELATEQSPYMDLAPLQEYQDQQEERQEEEQEDGYAQEDEGEQLHGGSGTEGAGLLRSSSTLLPAFGGVLQEASTNLGLHQYQPGSTITSGQACGWAKAYDMSKEAVEVLKAQQTRAACISRVSPGSPDKSKKGWAAAYDMSMEAQEEAARAAAAACPPPPRPGSPVLVGRTGAEAPGWAAAYDVSKEGREQARRLLREAQRQQRY